MAAPYRPKIGDPVWVEGHNPAWYGDDSDRYHNALVIDVNDDGATVEYYRDGDTEYFDNEYFRDKDHHPDDEGWGIWKIYY